ncbi:MAG TPA: HAMP domain-containing sensor histidine kinase [Acidobacteriaceae bacterium]|nr:HAMP domain-containing sensor histidine kinase [Acidobacteriaceae bacterium]
MMESNQLEERILVLAPVGRDGPAMADLLAGRGFTVTVCQSSAELCALILEGAGVLLLTEEALELAQLPELLDRLQTQPSWSELPIILLTQGGESRLARLLDTVAAAAGGITVLERPIAAATLVRAVEVAIRSRRRQYQVRDLIAESARQIAALKENERTIRWQEERLRKVEKLVAAGQLAASLAHEINNPLAAVTNALFILQNFSGLPDETNVLVNTAASELARVSRIVKQSLSYYRVDKSPKEVDLAQIVEESLRIFEEKFRKAGLTIHAKISPQTTILGFGDEIRQAIDNLLLNAVEATPRGGRLAVSLHRFRDRKDHSGSEFARLTIADTGSGISKDQFSHIFEPFFTTKEEKGNGLGLWVVQGIVAKHEGGIRIRSSTKSGHRGTVISILWPLPHKGHPFPKSVADRPIPQALQTSASH